MTLTAVSLFAGVEGIGLALESAGVDVVAAVEIDPAARGVIAHRYPDLTLFDDVTKVTGEQFLAAGFVPDRGVLAGGFPCQDLSVAGRRRGMGEGTRSGLFWHVDRLMAELRPAWVLLENVPGLLSSTCPCPGDGLCVDNGQATVCDDEPHSVKSGACAGGCIATHGGAMGAVLGSLGHRGYGFAYRVLDAQFFGVPQRRRRVFIVGHLGDGSGPVQVLLEPEGCAGNPAPGVPPRPRVAADSAVGSHKAGGGGDVMPALLSRYAKGTTSDADDGLVVSTLQGGGSRGYRIDAESAAGGHLGLVGGDGGSSRSQLVSITGPITHSLTSEGADASEDGTGRGTPIIGFSHTAGIDQQPSESVFPTIKAGHDGMPATATAVRRLTPLECERLQGFPDGWTTRSAGKLQADGPRYRQMGNAVAVPVVEWIVRRLVDVDAQMRDEA